MCDFPYDLEFDHENEWAIGQLNLMKPWLEKRQYQITYSDSGLAQLRMLGPHTKVEHEASAMSMLDYIDARLR